MTAKAAMTDALLKGKVLNVKNCFYLFGVTNCAREISRLIEKQFGIKVTRTEREGKTRYNHSCFWVDYSLTPTDENKEAIAKMVQYVIDQKKNDRKELHEAKPKKKVKQEVKGYTREVSAKGSDDDDFWNMYQTEPLPPTPTRFVQKEIFD